MATQQQVSAAGYACEFVDLVPSELQTECSICLHVLRDPQILDCCGYRFCKCCIERVLNELKTCPLCAQRNPTAIADKQLARILKQKKVKCTHKQEGCQWTGELALLDSHLDLTQRVEGCTFKSIRCMHCNIPYGKSHIEAHELTCPKKPVCCEYCSDHVCLRHELVEHWEFCDLYPIICPKGCGATITRQGLHQHQDTSCPLTIVECEYANIGCKVKIHRRDMKDHLNLCTKDHLTLLTEKYSQLKVSYEMEKEQNLQLLNHDSEVTKSEDVVLLKKLCEIRAEDGLFSDARDQVVVGNLPYRTTEQMIRSLFGQHGSIHAVKFYSSSMIAVVEYEHHDSIERLFHKYNSTGIKLLGSQLRCVQLGYNSYYM